jgi:HEAT repeat protein
MKRRTFSLVLLFTGISAGALLKGYRAHADTAQAALRGTALVYRGIPDDQVEQLTSPARIQSVVAQASDPSHVGAPSAIWQALEHGEKIECLDCIPAVENLLYSDNNKNREIAAWWLRRRIFGVFGKGQVYERATQSLATHADPVIRARAADALGEFLEGAGAAPLSTALVRDADPRVRAAAARALDRLNSPGVNGELTQALADTDPTVRLAALTAATHVHGFAGIAAVAGMLGDQGSPLVRRHAAAALGAMKARDAVPALMAMLAQETDPVARAEAAHALGLIGDPSARDALQAAAQDANGFVRDAALMAQRRL